MNSKRIAIAIGLALILGIVLIGGIRISKASELELENRSTLALVDLNSVELLDKLDHTRTLNHTLNLDLLLETL